MKRNINEERIWFVLPEYPFGRKCPGQVDGSGRRQSSREKIYLIIYPIESVCHPERKYILWTKQKWISKGKNVFWKMQKFSGAQQCSIKCLNALMVIHIYHTFCWLKRPHTNLHSVHFSNIELPKVWWIEYLFKCQKVHRCYFFLYGNFDI